MAPRRQFPRPIVLLTCGIAAFAVLAGCASGDPESSTTVTETVTADPSADPSPTETSASPTSSPTAGPSDEADDAAIPFPATADPVSQEPSAGAKLTVTDIRVGRHDGFDRVVFELGGSGTPGWTVRYVDQPTDDGSGNPVGLDGDAFLEVFITGTGYPMDTGVTEYSGPNPLDAEGTAEVEQVLYRGVFEGQTQAFVGIDDDDREPFRVFTLQDPTRVVVDLRAHN